MSAISFSPEVRALLDQLMAKEGVTEEEALRRAKACLRTYSKRDIVSAMKHESEWEN